MDIGHSCSSFITAGLVSSVFSSPSVSQDGILFGNRVSKGNHFKIGSLGWALVQYDCCPYQKRLSGHGERWGGRAEKMIRWGQAKECLGTRRQERGIQQTPLSIKMSLALEHACQACRSFLRNHRSFLRSQRRHRSLQNQKLLGGFSYSLLELSVISLHMCSF